jgi:hypothetical protein
MSNEAPNTQADALRSDEETVQLALAAAEAIKRLIAKRNVFHSRLTFREREVTRLSDDNSSPSRKSQCGTWP